MGGLCFPQGDRKSSGHGALWDIASFVLSKGIPTCFHASRSVNQKQLDVVCAGGWLAACSSAIKIGIFNNNNIFKHRYIKVILWRRKRKTWRRGEKLLMQLCFFGIALLVYYPHVTMHDLIPQLCVNFSNCRPPVTKWWPCSMFSSFRGFSYAAWGKTCRFCPGMFKMTARMDGNPCVGTQDVYSEHLPWEASSAKR